MYFRSVYVWLTGRAMAFFCCKRQGSMDRCVDIEGKQEKGPDALFPLIRMSYLRHFDFKSIFTPV